MRDLARRFGRRWALARLDLSVPVGGAMMLVGANGSGKTTLLRCIATALKPHQGGIRFDGRDLWEHRAELRPRIAFLSHATRLYDDLSAAENLRAWARMGGYRCDPLALLRRVGLPTDRREPARTFSAGMRRRLALACVLIKRPDLLLLDEPFSALDPQGRETMIEIVRELHARGTMLVVATHLPAVSARLCRQAVRLEAGQIVWRGASEDIEETR